MESASTSQAGQFRVIERDKDHPNGHDSRVFSNHSRPDCLPEDKDAILVMGSTGSGKSSLIATMTGASVEVGHSLKPCTATCKGWKYVDVAGQTFILIDTPGFDDLDRPDNGILESILDYVRPGRGLRVLAVIYLHRITDNRITGTSLLGLRIFQDFCGEHFYQNVVLATTMWDAVPEESFLRLEDREAQLNGSDVFWGDMIDKGSRYRRYLRTVESGRAILDICTRKNEPPPLKILLEMNNRRNLENTSAGERMTAALRKREAKLQQTLLEEAEELERERMILDAKKGKKAALQHDSQDKAESEQQAISNTGRGHKPQNKADKNASGRNNASYHPKNLVKKIKRVDRSGEGGSSKKDGQVHS